MIRREQRSRLALSLTSALLAVACGPAPTAQTETTGGGATTITQTSGGDAHGTATEDGDVGTLLVDVITPRLCESLRGSFIGLPGEGGHTGPASGIDPTAGRWWVRECTAVEHDGLLDLSITGTGWSWTDRESMGFQVRQYLRFDASARFTASMELAYDRPNRIVTIWMRPQGAVDASVTPRGLVEARATGVVSGMLGGLLELSGSSASARARTQVAEEGSQRLRDRFGAGFTVTYAMSHEQMDFMVGALQRGQLPERPYPAEPGVVWSVNQRLAIWPGGLDVIGPIDGNRGGHTIDFEMEEGEGVTIDAVCQADFERFYDLMLQGAPATAPVGQRVLDVTQLNHPERVNLPTLTCPTLLLATTRPTATMPIVARTRIFQTAVPPATTAAGQTPTAGGTTTTSTTAGRPAGRPVRVRIQGMTIATVAGTGSRWDMIGGEPDPYVVVVSVPGQREIERTQVVADQHEITLDHWLPGAYHPSDLPLRMSVYDDDVGADELIGVAELSAADAARGGEVRLEIRTTSDVPQTLGTMRLVIQAVQ